MATKHNVSCMCPPHSQVSDTQIWSKPHFPPLLQHSSPINGFSFTPPNKLINITAFLQAVLKGSATKSQPYLLQVRCLLSSAGSLQVQRAP